jgi:hypothetical protein
MDVMDKDGAVQWLGLVFLFVLSAQRPRVALGAVRHSRRRVGRVS